MELVPHRGIRLVAAVAAAATTSKKKQQTHANAHKHVAYVWTTHHFLSSPFLPQLLGMAFSMTLFHHIHRTGKKYDA